MLNDYNTSAHPLVLPEYGRQVHKMVEYCIALPSEEEQRLCANRIIEIMKMLSPNDQDRDDYEQILWDHLLLMAGGKLNKLSPYPINNNPQEKQHQHTSHLSYPQYSPLYRHYGHTIQKMVALISEMPIGEERTEKEKVLADVMKKAYVYWNKDNVDDVRIFTDLYEMSNGQIYLDEFTHPLPDAKQILGIPNQGGETKRKKKKK